MMKRLIATLAVTTLALTAAVRAEDKPAKVTVGYLNLVNAQLVADLPLDLYQHFFDAFLDELLQ